jgi:hypothetical protein
VGTLNYIKFAADELTRADQIRLIRFRQEKKKCDTNFKPPKSDFGLRFFKKNDKNGLILLFLSVQR